MSDIDMDMHGITPDYGHGGSLSDEEVGFSKKEHDLYEDDEVRVYIACIVTSSSTLTN